MDPVEGLGDLDNYGVPTYLNLGNHGEGSSVQNYEDLHNSELFGFFDGEYVGNLLTEETILDIGNGNQNAALMKNLALDTAHSNQTSMLNETITLHVSNEDQSLSTQVTMGFENGYNETCLGDGTLNVANEDQQPVIRDVSLSDSNDYHGTSSMDDSFNSQKQDKFDCDNNEAAHEYHVLTNVVDPHENQEVPTNGDICQDDTGNENDMYHVEEAEIDSAMNTIVESLAKSSKIGSYLTLDVLQSCLRKITNSHIFTCGRCLNAFSSMDKFQAHVIVCTKASLPVQCDKVDSSYINVLARTLFKGVVSNEIKKPSWEDQLDSKLDDVWKEALGPCMAKCRNLFIAAAESIVSRRWVTTAISNEIHRVSRTRTPRELKLPVVETKKTRETRKRKRSSSSDRELRLAIRSVTKLKPYTVTPETPVSDVGNEVEPDSTVRQLSESSPETELMQTGNSAPNEDIGSQIAIPTSTTATPPSAGSATPSTREDESNSDGSPLSENEYVVERILARRPDTDVPDSEYEYLIKWEGYGHEANTWEPYEHLARCPNMLAEFKERMEKKKSLRIRL